MRFLSPYPSELEVEHTSTSSAEVCYLDTNIKTGDINTSFLISIYNRRDDFTFRIVNFPHMDSNISASPAYGVYIQLFREWLSEKVHTTILKGIVGGFEFTVL